MNRKKTVRGGGPITHVDDDGFAYSVSTELDEDSGAFWLEAPVRDGAGWYLSALFLPIEGAMVLSELKVFPGVDRGFHLDDGRPRSGERRTDQRPLSVGEWSEGPKALAELPQGGITARLLRRVRISDLMKLVRNELDLLEQFGQPFMPQRWAAVLRRAPARPGRAGRDDQFYLVWARRYVRALTETDKPVNLLARRHRKKPDHIRALLYKARSRGLLTSAPLGRAGGELTEKAEELLKREENDLGQS